ncbi:MAG: RNA-binding S4 domain-containing protein [Chitinophagaceae bacterium]|jgi:ribosome-associated heat shock protein Hsp15
MESEKLRLDKYLWAIRLFKTRSAAAVACEKGRVKMNGENIKASRTVRVNDVYEVKTEEKRWTIKITGLLSKRVQYKEAIQFYEDLTPPEETERIAFQSASFFSGKRLSKIGRPTKKERRDLDDFTDNN